jgi:hypothetical protein
MWTSSRLVRFPTRGRVTGKPDAGRSSVENLALHLLRRIPDANIPDLAILINELLPRCRLFTHAARIPLSVSDFAISRQPRILTCSLERRALSGPAFSAVFMQ